MASVRISTASGNLEFEVRDDGVGFDQATAPPGSGLTNMTDRIDALGGRLELTSTPGAGTTVSGSLPTELAATPS
jgi:signal transduction histidine kinase